MSRESLKQEVAFSGRRAAYLDAMNAESPSAVAVLTAAPVTLRNNDVEHDYRQASDFYYLTGFVEPESVLVLDANTRTTTLFVRPRDPAREVWVGPRAGVEGAKDAFGVDEAFPIAEFDERLVGALSDRKRLYYALGSDRTFDDRVLSAISRVRSRHRAGMRAPSEIVEPGAILHEMRLRKSPGELDRMRAAARITKEGHEEAMRRARPGMGEYEVEALLFESFRGKGAERLAYPTIVGSGPNACTLHHTRNDRLIQDGDLVLIDAGCEFEYYASDVTRTFPVGRDFSREQQAIYELVLEAQLEAIGASRSGASLRHVHDAAVKVLVHGLIRFGLLSGTVEEVIAAEGYKRFYMHRTSHWLGMDVHDVGSYNEEGKPRLLEPGMVLTVEPGVYISPQDDTVPPEWRGIGVRIEDDVAITQDGVEVLTAGIPKTPDELRHAQRG
jgi:Xaa-Pro aminopeptidase